MTYSLSVLGTFYCGTSGRYTYKVSEAQARALKAGQVKASSLAGDFLSVSAWELWDVETASSKGPGWVSSTRTKRRLASFNWRRPVAWEE